MSGEEYTHVTVESPDRVVVDKPKWLQKLDSFSIGGVDFVVRRIDGNGNVTLMVASDVFVSCEDVRHLLNKIDKVERYDCFTPKYLEGSEKK